MFYFNYFQVLGNVEKARQILEAALEKDKASVLPTYQFSPYEGKISAGFPIGLEKWEGIFQWGNFEQTRKVRENHTKYWKNKEFQINVLLFYWYLNELCIIWWNG